MEYEDKLTKLLIVSGLLQNSDDDDDVFEEGHKGDVENVNISHDTEYLGIESYEADHTYIRDGGDLYNTEKQRLSDNEGHVVVANMQVNADNALVALAEPEQNNGMEDKVLNFETGLFEDTRCDYAEHENDILETASAPISAQTQDVFENYALNPETGFFDPDPSQSEKNLLRRLVNPVTGVLEEVEDVVETESANDSKRGKKRKRNPKNWERTKIIKNNLKNHKMRPIPNCRCKCQDKINENECLDLFNSFVNLSTHTEQNIYLQGCIKDAVPKRFRPRSKSSPEKVKNRRVFEYCISVGNKTVNVCQQAFLAIYGIKRDRLKRKIQHREKDIQDGRGRHSNHPTYDSDTMAKVHEFLRSLPARESHHSRSSNKFRRFLDSNLSISLLHRKFLTDYSEKSITYEKFRDVFNTDYNYSFRPPRKDICHTCEKLKVNIDAADVNNKQDEKKRLLADKELHLRKAEAFLKRLSNAEKETDATKLALCIDFQKNLPLPVTNVGDEYYLRQLWMHNFGIHNLTENTATMYLYTENYALKGPNEVISALSDYIDTNKKPSQTRLEIYCDNCYGQNKNRYMFSFLDNLCAIGKFETVSVYFPIPGHSMMPIDRDFALIERKRLKCEKIYTPELYVELILNSKNTNKFNIVFLEKNLSENLDARVVKVKDYKTLLDSRVRSSIPGISTCRQVVFRKNGKPEMSQSMTSTNLNRFELYRSGFPRIIRDNPEDCYNGQIKLKEAKVKDIKKLLEYVPEHLRYFYADIIEINGHGDHAAEDLADEYE